MNQKHWFCTKFASCHLQTAEKSKLRQPLSAWLA